MFTELIAKDKANPELKWYLGNTQYGLGLGLKARGSPSEARTYFGKSLTIRQELLLEDPGNIQRKIELMLVNAQLGNAADAVKDARAVEQYAPHNPGKLFFAACAYALAARNSSVQQRSSNDDAIRVLRSAIGGGFRDPWVLQHAPELGSLQSIDA